MFMLSGRRWAVGELFGAIGEALGGSQRKPGKRQPHKPSKDASQASAGSPANADQIRKARMRGIFSAIEQGGLRKRD
jgi:hypothetical protein